MTYVKRFVVKSRFISPIGRNMHNIILWWKVFYYYYDYDYYPTVRNARVDPDVALRGPDILTKYLEYCTKPARKI